MIYLATFMIESLALEIPHGNNKPVLIMSQLASCMHGTVAEDSLLDLIDIFFNFGYICMNWNPCLCRELN